MFFQLHEPGSFRMCATPECEHEAVKFIEALSQSVPDALGSASPLGIILTGSLSRAEGTLTRDSDGKVRWLSDVECLVVFQDDCSISREVRAALENAAQGLTDRSRAQATGLKVQLSAIRARSIVTMRPSIFKCELLQHGKLIWARSPGVPLTCDRETDAVIPRQDALRLLSNRVMELIPPRLKLADGAQDNDLAYALNKFWLDAGTSLSVFLNCYQPNYAERSRAVGNCLISNCHSLNLRTAHYVARKVCEATNVKLGRAPVGLDVTERDFADAAGVGADLWYWQTDQLLSTASSSDAPDWREIPARLRRLQTTRQRIRDWSRLAVRTKGIRVPTVNGIWQILRAGSFGSAIYAAGCLLQFFWDEVASGQKRGVTIAQSLGNVLGVNGESSTAGRRQLAERTFRYWEYHLRDSSL
jgi:hypothetical protein